MQRRAFWGIFGFAWLAGGIGAPEPGLLACRGSFGEFAGGQLVARPSEVNFVVDWIAPSIATETGRPARIAALTSLAIVFDVPYDDYVARYRIDRIDGSISQTSNFGGLFRGDCELKPITTRF